VTDSTFAKLDALYMLATDTIAHASLSLISSTYNGTNTAMTFTANQGIVYSGGGANFNSTFDPSTAISPNFVASSASIGVWDNAAGAGDGNVIFQDGQGDRIYTTLSGTSALANLNTSNNMLVANTVAAGLYHMNISSASATGQFYKNGTSIATATGGTSAVNSGNLQLGPGSSTDSTLVFWIGGSLTGADAANISARMHAYLQTIAGIP
jgi:hypothetical protein